MSLPLSFAIIAILLGGLVILLSLVRMAGPQSAEERRRADAEQLAAIHAWHVERDLRRAEREFERAERHARQRSEALSGRDTIGSIMYAGRRARELARQAIAEDQQAERRPTTGRCVECEAALGILSYRGPRGPQCARCMRASIDRDLVPTGAPFEEQA